MKDSKMSTDMKKITLNPSCYQSKAAFGLIIILASTVQPLISQQVPAANTLPGSKAQGGISELTWDERFGFAGVSGDVYALAMMDHDLFVGGRFFQAGDANLDPLGRAKGSIARWDGSKWHALGNGFQGYVFALEVFDGKLYAGGAFAIGSNIAFWNGSGWSTVGSGLGSGISQPVYALEAAGGKLYAGGKFTTASGVSANYIAVWDGNAWSPLGTGMQNTLGSTCYVSALAAVGTDLFAGGLFTKAGGVDAPGVARWDGSQWNALDRGTSAAVLALISLGPDLYAGGAFETAGGQDVNGIARWNGSQWFQLGSGMDYEVRSLTVYESNLVAGGFFTNPGDIITSCIARWNGSQWSAFGEGISGNVGMLSPRVLALTTDGSRLYAGGMFTIAGSAGASMVAGWNGSGWSSLGNGMGITGGVNALLVDGINIYAGGYFTSAGNAAASNIARWDGTRWQPLGAGVNDQVLALAKSGANLYTTGWFTQAGTVTSNNVACWDGSQWKAVPNPYGLAQALAVNGNNLYIGGVGYVSKWNGTQWTDLAQGFDLTGDVSAMAFKGQDLFAAGNFEQIKGITANSIARWNGSSWFPLGDGLTIEGPTYRQPGTVRSMAVIGSYLYVSGNFDWAGNVDVDGIARWDGSQWSAIGSPKLTDYPILAVGDNLYANDGVMGLYRWDGTSWTRLVNGTMNMFNTSLNAMAYDGEGIWFGGTFTTAGGIVSAHIAHCTGIPTGVSGEAQPAADVFIERNFPNPFRSTTTIRIWIGKQGKISLKVLDVSGNLVATLLTGDQPAGYLNVSWNAGTLPAGLYYASLESDGRSSVHKMMRLR